jgi:hypothetical protein
MGDNKDLVWEHGEKIGIGFKCKYCRIQKGGGGATRLKEHLAHRGKNIMYCPSVPKEVKEYFGLDIDKTRNKKKERDSQRARENAVARSNFVVLEADDEDPDLQAAIRQSREEHVFIERTGQQYKRGGGSGLNRSGGPLPRMLSKSTTEVPERARDYNLASSSSPIQPQIDTGPWIDKGKNTKTKVGRAWAKFCQSSGIPGRKVDNPYFRVAILET